MGDKVEDEDVEVALFVAHLDELLIESRYDEAVENFTAALDCGSTVDRALFGIIPKIVYYLINDETIVDKKRFEVCSGFLTSIADKCNHKEVMVLLLEHFDHVKNPLAFESLIKPLGKCFKRDNPNRRIDWCANVIKKYVESLPIPESERENEETNNLTVERLHYDFQTIFTFLETVVSCAMKFSILERKTRDYLTFLHLILFGEPFCYVHNLKISKKEPENPEKVYAILLKQMSLFNGNFLKFQNIVEARTSKPLRKSLIDDENNESCDILRSRDSISDLTYANYYYYVFATDEGINNIPQIYDYRYLMKGCFYLGNLLLETGNPIFVPRALLFVETIVTRINERTIGHLNIESTNHSALLLNLMKTMIYCDSNVHRQLALKIFKNYIDRFTIRARYLIIINLYEITNHSGALALLTNITKTTIIQCLEEKPLENESFLKTKLERLLKIICRLPNGSSTDLIEISDEIIAALNLLRFLSLRDKDDSTGFWSTFRYLEENYLKPLRIGIDLSRRHYCDKIKEIEDEMINQNGKLKKNGNSMNEILDKKISISVGGQELPMLPISEKKMFCEKAINALDVMESILVRLNECIDENPLSKVTKSH